MCDLGIILRTGHQHPLNKNLFFILSGVYSVPASTYTTTTLTQYKFVLYSFRRVCHIIIYLNMILCAAQQHQLRTNGVSYSYRRVLCDLSMILHHIPAALHILGNDQLLTNHLLGLLKEVQGLLPACRVLGGDVADSTQQYMAACNLEIVLALTLSEVWTSSFFSDFLQLFAH